MATAVNIQNQINDLKKAITCPICLECFNDPVSLNVCPHSFCKYCLFKAMEIKGVCPICVRACTQINIISSSYTQSVIDKIAFMIEDVLKPYLIEKNLLVENVKSLNSVSRLPISSASSSLQSSSSSSSSSAFNALNDYHTKPNSLILYKIGDTVSVKSRMWSGINKPGGIAWVTAITTTDADQGIKLYDVKYVLTGNKEKNIPATFVEAAEDLTKDRTERRRNTQGKRNGALRDLPVSKDNDMNIHFSESTRKRSKVVRASENSDCSSFSSKQPDYHLQQPQQDSYISSSASSSSSSSSQSSSSIYNGRSIVILTTGIRCEDNQLVTDFIKSFNGVSLVYNFQTINLTTPLNSSTNTSTGKMVQPITTDSINELCTKNTNHTDQTNHPVLQEMSTVSHPQPTLDAPATHLVVAVDENNVFPQRTMKYMQAVMAGVWIVNMGWIRDSLQHKQLLPESDYEVRSCCKASVDHAPYRARVHMYKTLLQLKRGNTSNGVGSTNVIKGIFTGVVILLYGHYPSPGPLRSQLYDLLILGGAVVCLHLSEFLHECLMQKSVQLSPPYKYKIVICSTIEEKANFTSEAALQIPNILLQSNNVKEISSVKKSKKKQIVSSNGNSISNNSNNSNTNNNSNNNDYSNNNDIIIDEPMILSQKLDMLLNNTNGKGIWMLTPLWILDTVTNYNMDTSSFGCYLHSY